MPSVPPPSGSSQPPEAPEPSERPSAPPSRPAHASQAPARAKRPRYLAVALVGALVFGAGCWTEGCSRINYYRGGLDETQTLNSSITNDADRARAEALYQHFVEVADAERGRAFPLSIATFLLGAALLALAARGLAGKTNTRTALVQVVTAQAVVVVLGYFVMSNVRNAELDWGIEQTLYHQRETLTSEQYVRFASMTHNVRRYGVPGWLVVRTLASALIVFALTRPRSREFFEAAGKPVSEG
ncbi:MAG: hypothetical protein JWP87_573 [Labilithrix sp.]|nr:hypothetical protein [Labilithrix sp.]